MIHKFTAKNFYSFKDAVEANFEVNQNAPYTTGYVRNFNSRVSKVLAVIGPNASGKTNLLKVLPFLQFFIATSFNLKPDEKILFYPYKFSSEDNDPTELSVTFSCKGSLYEYFVKLNQSQVLDERLRKYNNSTKQFSILFKRTWNDAKNDYEYDLTNFITTTKVKAIIRKRGNASLLSTAAQIDHKLSNEIVAYWSMPESNVIEFGKHDHPEFIAEAAKYYYENSEARKTAENLLTRFDLGLTKLPIEKHTHKSKSGKEETYYVPIGFHKGGKSDYSIPFLYESGGTKALFSILAQIIPVLSKGSIAVLDEFDADLHPRMLPELIDLFMSEESNPKNAQLLFSTHHHEILNKLDKYQIMIVEKNREDGMSEIWRLDEVGIRADDNYYSKYSSGAYGGVPEL